MDGWFSINADPYLSFTAHFIDDGWSLQTHCLHTMYYPEQHAAENLACFVKDSLRTFDLRRGNLVTITTDNAVNMIATGRLLG